ncbi:DUF2917 domain-containing protein [Ramlibacter algicola]|uniref:DUF2917 domain-containing protein n=1 Tax=Ramlibacter algicola TaxID=2795217 RepID=A0A934Q1A4_9BURK|nr:DUF2917 domain-containing protein [Ramlibacter algicola]MBK0392444.1 DUF2917 domain-containing protein [Ramlibacter algicola]
MHTLDAPGCHRLPARTLAELPSRRPLEVASAGGTLWLTLDGDPRDLVLERGERVLIEAPGRVIAQAFDAAVLELRTAERIFAAATPKLAFAS